NPFNPTTKISYALPKSGLVTLKVYDILGKEVATLVNEVKNVGSYTIDFNGSNLSSGVYFYKLSVGDFSSIKKMTLIK
ncbi:MAG: T9SS type A sorting domain-containing protein, partial [Ignavibacteria bacterium]